MELPTKDSIKFAQKSAKKITAVKIEAETFIDYYEVRVCRTR